MGKLELSEICEKEFTTFSSAIKKMGFDSQGFAFMILMNRDGLTREKLFNGFDLTEEEKISLENRVKLLG